MGPHTPPPSTRARAANGLHRHWLRNHLEITNVDDELVVPIRVTRDEYIAFFNPEAKEEPEEGIEAFLHARYKEQLPEAQPFGDAKSATKRMKATYHPVVHKEGTQEYLPQEGQGEERI